MELLHDDIGDDEFREIAASLAAHTFAAQQLDHGAQDLLAQVFTMRATRLSGLRTNGRIGWIRETGARARLIDSVIVDLVPLLDDWGTIETPRDGSLIDAFLTWAYRQPDFQSDLREAFPDAERIPPQDLPNPASVRDIVLRWVKGESFADIATATNRTVDGVLRIYGSVISYSLATLVEQAVAVLQRYLADTDVVVAEAVLLLPEYLRFGVSTPAARALMAAGVRHRRAAVLLGEHPAMTDFQNVLREHERSPVKSSPPRTAGRTRSVSSSTSGPRRTSASPIQAPTPTPGVPTRVLTLVLTRGLMRDRTHPPIPAHQDRTRPSPPAA